MSVFMDRVYLFGMSCLLIALVFFECMFLSGCCIFGVPVLCSLLACYCIVRAGAVWVVDVHQLLCLYGSEAQ